MRRWRLHRRTDLSFAELARMDQPDRAGLDALLRRVLPDRADPLLARINAYLMRWVRKKYKRLRAFKQGASELGSASPSA